MAASLQRLGDNPRDHDGHFHGFSDAAADVNGLRPDAPSPSSHLSNTKVFEPWKIYPPPPPPHWHWSPKTPAGPTGKQSSPDANEDFDFAKCEIPAAHSWEYEIDDKGVFQLYDRESGTHFGAFKWYTHRIPY